MTKRMMLEALFTNRGGWSLPFAARHFGLPESHVGAVLRRLEVQRLVDPGYGRDGRLVRTINKRGIDRVHYWRAQDAAEAAAETETIDPGYAASADNDSEYADSTEEAPTGDWTSSPR